MYLSLENMNDTKILFVDLDGTLIKEDLSNLAFIDFIKDAALDVKGLSFQ